MQKGKLFIISGPSGVGKTTVRNLLLERDPSLYFSVSATTWPQREGEQDGVDYHFLDTAAFRKLIEEDALLEHAEYVGNCYGTPEAPVNEMLAAGHDVLLDIEVQGAAQVAAKRPDAVRIFVIPPSWEELERRLQGRGTDTPEKIRQRLERAKAEFAQAEHYDYYVVNDTVEHAAQECAAIFAAEHCRPAERKHLLKAD